MRLREHGRCIGQASAGKICILEELRNNALIAFNKAQIFE